MFGLLKNKLSNFISSLAGREEKKPAEAPSEKPQEQAATGEVPEKKPQASALKPEMEAEKKIPEREQKRISVKKEEPKPKQVEIKAEETPAQKKQVPAPQVALQEEASAPTPVIVAEKKKTILDIVASPFSKKAEAAKEEAKKPTAAPPELKNSEVKLPGQKKSEAVGPEIHLTSQKLALQAKPEVKSPEQKKSWAQIQAPKPQTKPEMPASLEQDLSRLAKRAGVEKRDIALKIGLGTSIKSFFSSEITIGEAEISDLLEELELSLLEADVAYDVSVDVISQLRVQLVGMKVPKGEVGARTKGAIQGVLESVMDSDRKFDLVKRVKSLPRPVKILFVGPNGAGKTTTMAKLAHMLLGSGLTVVFSASDTFRAAAIEQTEVHAGRLGVKVIKSKYGADPASVAFDAINYARANSIDVVLIDSAGRQDTNANLLSELVKINRIAKPDIKVYVGESIGGNSIIDQIRAFNEAIGMDGAILTKIDCDAKGGTAISVAKSTGIPILFLGVGQGYGDLVPFDPHKVASEIMS